MLSCLMSLTILMFGCCFFCFRQTWLGFLSPLAEGTGLVERDGGNESRFSVNVVVDSHHSTVGEEDVVFAFNSSSLVSTLVGAKVKCVWLIFYFVFVLVRGWFFSCWIFFLWSARYKGDHTDEQQTAHDFLHFELRGGGLTSVKKKTK
uniref:Transmembrane protein n=1 Tax=Cacopsylla melanoneura TaxID=428564 RepID=A0A8D8UGN4_9HEMI